MARRYTSSRLVNYRGERFSFGGPNEIGRTGYLTYCYGYYCPPSDGSPEQYDGLEAMPATVRLNDIVDALEMQFDESSSFLDRDTGRVETVSQVLLREAEESGDDEEPDLPTWQKQEWCVGDGFLRAADPSSHLGSIRPSLSGMSRNQSLCAFHPPTCGARTRHWRQHR